MKSKQYRKKEEILETITVVSDIYIITPSQYSSYFYEEFQYFCNYLGISLFCFVCITGKPVYSEHAI